MEAANSLLWEVSIAEFLLVTVCLAGGTGYLTGRAVALTWRSNATLVGYMILLACATRFIHFALFEGTLLSLHYFIVDLAVIVAIAFLGMRITRARQMARQYGFLYAKRGLLSWQRRR